MPVPKAQDVDRIERDKCPLLILLGSLLLLACACKLPADERTEEPVASAPTSSQVVSGPEPEPEKEEKVVQAEKARGHKPQQPVEPLTFEVLRGPWLPYDVRGGYGAEILLSREPKSREEVLELVSKLTAGKDPVSLNVWLSRGTWERASDFEYGPDYKANYLLSITRNKSVRDRAFYGREEIRWMQEDGNFEDLFGTTEPLRAKR